MKKNGKNSLWLVEERKNKPIKIDLNSMRPIRKDNWYAMKICNWWWRKKSSHFYSLFVATIYISGCWRLQNHKRIRNTIYFVSFYFHLPYGSLLLFSVSVWQSSQSVAPVQFDPMLNTCQNNFRERKSISNTKSNKKTKKKANTIEWRKWTQQLK